MSKKAEIRGWQSPVGFAIARADGILELRKLRGLAARGGAAEKAAAAAAFAPRGASPQPLVVCSLAEHYNRQNDIRRVTRALVAREYPADVAASAALGELRDADRRDEMASAITARRKAAAKAKAAKAAAKKAAAAAAKKAAAAAKKTEAPSGAAAEMGGVAPPTTVPTPTLALRGLQGLQLCGLILALRRVENAASFEALAAAKAERAAARAAKAARRAEARAERREKAAAQRQQQRAAAKAVTALAAVAAIAATAATEAAPAASTGIVGIGAPIRAGRVTAETSSLSTLTLAAGIRKVPAQFLGFKALGKGQLLEVRTCAEHPNVGVWTRAVGAVRDCGPACTLDTGVLQ